MTAPVSPSSPPRDPWIRVGVALSVVASGIALVVTLRQKPPVPETRIVERVVMVPASAGPGVALGQQSLSSQQATRVVPGSTGEGVAPVPFAFRRIDGTGNPRHAEPPPPAVAEVADSLHLRAETLAALAGAGGRLSPAVERALRDARTAGADFARDAKLDDEKGDLVARIFTGHAMRLLQQQHADGPGAPVDPAALQAATQDTLDDLRAALGPEALAAALPALDRLAGQIDRGTR